MKLDDVIEFLEFAVKLRRMKAGGDKIFEFEKVVKFPNVVNFEAEILMKV
jgi:hypothetical protein